MNPFKFPWTLVIAVLFVTVSLARSQLLYHGRRLRIAPKECSSSSRRFESLSGVCMFNLECQEKSGTVIGACVDQFLFGACCHLPNFNPALYQLQYQQSLEDDSLEGTEVPSTIPTPTVSSTTTAKSFPTFSSVNDNNLNRTVEDFNSTSSVTFLENLYNVSLGDNATVSTTTVEPDGDGPKNYSRNSMEGSSDSSTESSFLLSPSAKPKSPNPTPKSSTTISISSTEFYSTRFQPRPSPAGVVNLPSSGVQVHSHQDETLDALHRTDIPLAIGEHSTSPSPSVSDSFHPLTLETFSSVSDPVRYGVHGNRPHVPHAHGQSNLAVEPTSLTLVTIVNSPSSNSKDSNSNSVSIIKRTSTSTSSNSDSGIIISSTNYNSNSGARPGILGSTSAAGLNSKFSSLMTPHTTTLSPPKLSTFLYVDGEMIPQQPPEPEEDATATNSIITTDHNSFLPETTETDTISINHDDVVRISEKVMRPNTFREKYQSTPMASSISSSSPSGGMMMLPDEDLNSNTENVWSVVMQLGPHGTNDPKKPPEVSSGEADEDFSHLPIIASTMHSSGVTGSAAVAAANQKYQSPIGPSALPLLASVLETADAEEDFWRTTLGSVDKEVSQDLKNDDIIPPVLVGGTGISKIRPVIDIGDRLGGESNFPVTSDKYDDDDEAEDSTEGDRYTAVSSTQKPWASSTYTIHTFQYPHMNQTYSSDSEEESEETTSYSSTTAFERMKNSSMIENGLMTWLSVDLHNNEVTTTEKDEPTQSPSTGDLKEDDSAQEMYELAEGLKHSTVFQKEIEEYTKPTIFTTTTTTSTTTTPTTTTKRVTKRVTTTTATTATPPTTAETTTTTKMPSRGTTTKWKRPSTYTISPDKKYRPTTTTTTTTTEPPPTRRTTPVRRIGVASTTTKPPKIVTKPPTTTTTTVKSTTPLLLAEEDIDTNLDYLVDQVVQNMAESLSGSDLDEAIKHPSSIYDSPTFPDKFSQSPSLNNDVQQLIKGNTKKNKDKGGTTRRPHLTPHRNLDYRKDCGVRTLKKSGRIVGGTASKFGQWPWQALVKEATWLGLFSKNKCGGVLIAPKFVLTAAHCQPGFLATLTVVLGDFDISSGKDKQSTQSVTKNVRRVIVHRDYNAQTFENDIALLELESAVEYAPHIVPICLPEDQEDFVGQHAFVTGWGRLKYGGSVPQILHEVDVPVLTNDNCQEMFQKSGHLKAIRESFICAGYAEGLKDSCEGDSGGPLSIKRETGQWVLAGTVSHGIKCAYPNLPGVYMRMTFYKPWIKKVTGLKT